MAHGPSIDATTSTVSEPADAPPPPTATPEPPAPVAMPAPSEAAADPSADSSADPSPVDASAPSADSADDAAPLGAAPPSTGAATPTSPQPAAGAEADPATAQAVADAYAVGADRTTAAAVAVLDLQMGVLYSGGDIDEQYASASLVKVFIAARLLTEGKVDDLKVRDRMWKMITVSDDDAGSYLYGLAGAEGLVPWIAGQYGISGLAPADEPGYWGLTRITARGMVTFYGAVIADPAVGPWLLDAMGQAQVYGSDGFYQHFGLPSAATHWRVKQGWMCCLENRTRMHSTGYVDSDRYAVALLASGPASLYGDAGATALTEMALALLPNGTVPTSA